MNNKYSQYLRILFEILYHALPGAGLLVVLDVFFAFGWPHIAAVLLSVFFQGLIHWSEEKGLRFQLWGIIFVLNAVMILFFYQKGSVTEFTLTLLGLEAMCVAVSVLCYLGRYRLWVKLPLALTLFAALVYFCFWQIAVSKWEVCLCLLFFLLLLSETAEKRNSRFVKWGNDHMIYLFPLFLGVVVLLFFLPVKQHPIRWERLKSAVKAVSDKAEDIVLSVEYLFSGRDNTYSMSFAGFEPDGTLGGSIYPMDSVQISVKGVGTKSPLYLSGSIFGNYTGQKWEPVAGQKPYQGTEYALNYKEIMSAFSNSIYTQEEMQKLIHYCNYNITYQGLKTESLFITPATKNVLFNDKVSLAKKQSDSLTMAKPENRGFGYDVKFIEIDYANEITEELLRQRAFKNLPRESEERIKRREYIHETYTKLPEALPERVKELADEITAGADNEYDKLKAIEAYLREYVYSKSPEPVPGGKDFTDYFLFESRSGYCTYFATAMAVLARCEDIPTRYVEGFATTGTIHKKNKTIHLTGGDSHAWPEAYIDHVGWIPFEPTPGYQENSDASWEEPKKPDEHGEIGDMAQEKPELFIQEDTETMETAEGNVNIKSVLLKLAGMILILALFLILICSVAAVKRVLNKKAYYKMSEYDKMLYLMQCVLHFGVLYRIAMENGETLSDYAIRIQGILDTEKMTFVQMCRLFQSIRFGGKDVLDSDIRETKQYILALERQYTQSCGWMQKTWYCCVK